MRTNRRAGVALLVLLATAVPPRAAESTAFAQASSPAISTQTVPPAALRHGVKAALIAADQRKAAAQAIPLRTLRQGTGATIPSTGPRLLHFEDFQRGLDVVPVKKSGPARPSQSQTQSSPEPPPQPRPQLLSPPAPLSAPTSEAVVPVKIAQKPATLRRLPPVDRIAPAAPIPQRSRLPQEPIALYPETGYE